MLGSSYRFSFAEMIEIPFAKGDVVLTASTDEDRSRVAYPDAVKVTQVNVLNHFEAEVDGIGKFSLRKTNDLDQLSTACRQFERVFIDITGLPYSGWAPIVKHLCARIRSLYCIYIEPESYSMHPAPIDGAIYDLSERIDGIAPIPGFANISGAEADSPLVIFSGFEGTRMRHICEETEISGSDVHVVIGVPGFKSHYPFVAMQSNMDAIDAIGLRVNIGSCGASDPFGAFDYVRNVIRSNAGNAIRVAPIGTKPQGLGAILSAIMNDRKVEIIYDNPTRSKRRSRGVGIIHVYSIGEFINAVN